MKIVIVGGGKVGSKLCEELSLTTHDITLVEQDETIANNLINKYDIDGIIGNGTNIEILQEAGIEHTDIFIGVTASDEVNIISAVLAKRLGAKSTIARVRNPEYSSHSKLLGRSLDINLIINPEFETGQHLARLLKYSSALNVESFAGDQVNLVKLEIPQGSNLDGLSLIDFRNQVGSVIVCAIQRQDQDEQIIIPKGPDHLYGGDHIYVTGNVRDMARFMESVHGKSEIESVFIVGGGRIAYYLLKILSNTNMFVRLLEVNKERAEHLSQEFPNAEIMVADGTDHDILDEQNVSAFDAFISLTGIDEENLVVSLYAQSVGIEKVVTKMDRMRLLNLLEFDRLKSFVTPKLLVADEILQFVRSRHESVGSNIEALYRLENSKIEALQFIITEPSEITDTPLMHLDISSQAIIAYIIRKNQLIFPTGQDEIWVGDHVIAVTTITGVDGIDDLLEVGE